MPRQSGWAGALCVSLGLASALAGAPGRAEEAAAPARPAPAPAPAPEAGSMDHGAMHGQGMDHGAMHGGGDGPASVGPPVEPGQGAFGAMIEIVERLRADPNTDWRRADLGALRAHLRDMAMLMLHATPVDEPIPGGLMMLVPTEGPGGGAVSRMVPAHAAFLVGETGWRSEVEARPGVVEWRVTGDEAQIRGLGFFGLMAVGNHHQAHHLAIATGADPHAH